MMSFINVLSRRFVCFCISVFCTAVCAFCNEPVTYLDAEGKECVVENYTILTGEETTLTRGWYVVKGNVNFDHRITLRGKVRVILMDDSKVNVCMSGYETTCIGEDVRSTFQLYSQSFGDKMGSVFMKPNNSCYLMDIENFEMYGGNIIVDSNEISEKYFVVEEFTMYNGRLVANKMVQVTCSQFFLKGGLIDNLGLLWVVYSVDLGASPDLLSVLECVYVDNVQIPKGYVVIIDGESYVDSVPAELLGLDRSIIVQYDEETYGVLTGIAYSLEELCIYPEGWYILGGTRLSVKPTTSGIYIHDGRKVVVR